MNEIPQTIIYHESSNNHLLMYPPLLMHYNYLQLLDKCSEKYIEKHLHWMGMWNKQCINGGIDYSYTT